MKDTKLNEVKIILCNIISIIAFSLVCNQSLVAACMKWPKMKSRKKTQLFIKPRVQELGIGARIMQKTLGMLTRIQGNLLEYSREYYHFNIPGNVQKISGNVQKGSGEYSGRFCGMFQKIPGDVPEDYSGCSKTFRGMSQNILGNVKKDSQESSKRFLEI